MEVKTWISKSALIVMVLIGLTLAFRQSDFFQEKIFTNKMLQMFRYAHEIATATECEVKIAYHENQITLRQRENCTHKEFSKTVHTSLIYDSAPEYRLKVPNAFSVYKNFPIYIDKDGKVYDEKHVWQKKVEFQFKTQSLIIDGLSGFAYEKFY